MKVIHTNGRNKNFYQLCLKLDESLSENVPGRRDSGMNSLYNVKVIKDVFLLFDGKKAIGSACLWCHDSDTCEVIRVFMDADYRGRGLVKMLIDEVEHLARKKGYSQIHLRTWSCTPYSVRAYTKQGFKFVGGDDYKYRDKFPGAVKLAALRVYMKKEF